MIYKKLYQKSLIIFFFIIIIIITIFHETLQEFIHKMS